MFLTKMNFELLPNELILYLFEYLSVIQLFHGFLGLNSRFNKLLYEQFQKFHLDFRLISKTNFNHICQNYLPLIINRVRSLRLSNDDDTPQQIELFLSQDFKLRQFIRLQSLSLSDLRSQQTLEQIIIECSYLPYLTHLTFTDGYISMTKNDVDLVFNEIWKLPKLTYCYLDINFACDNNFPNPTVVSTSLRYLIIRNITSSLSSFNGLCRYTPYLEYLSMNFEDDFPQMESPIPFPSITRLKILFQSPVNNLQHLLASMPNLYHLSWESYFVHLNGHQWEEIIKTYLPKLKIFQFKIEVSPTQ